MGIGSRSCTCGVTLFSALTLILAGQQGAGAAQPVTSDVPKSPPASTVARRTQSSQEITVDIVLPLKDAAGAAVFVDRVTNPADPLYGNFLTPRMFADRFGADAASYRMLEDWAKAKGLSPGEPSASRTILSLRGTASLIEAAFGVKMFDYKLDDGRTTYAADRPPSLPDDLATRVSSIIGLSGLNRFEPLLRILPQGSRTMSSGHGPNGAFDALDLRTAYNVPPQSPSIASETLAVFEQGGYFPSDVATYLTKNKLPNVPVAPRLVNGYGGGVNDPGVEFEAVLDIDMEIAMNPAAKQVLVYEDGDDSFGVALLDALTAMANDDTAQTISISYGTDEAIQGSAQIAAEGPLFLQLAAQGQQVFASTGDDGAYGRTGVGYNVSDPSTQPYLTAVGGTTLFTNNAALYQSEETWNLLNSYHGATGGGISTYWPIPTYQQFVGRPNGASKTYRNVPDVAAVANPETGVAVYSSMNGGWNTIGGTSVSSPIWAGFYSVLNAAKKGAGLGPVGFLNPPLYKFSKGGNVPYFDENDVKDGTNGSKPIYHLPGFSAGPGYDNTTGWGSIIGYYFVRDFIVGPLVNGKNPPAPPTGLIGSTTATSASITWNKAEGALGYAVLGAGPTYITPTAFTTGNSATVSGLEPNTSYSFVVYSLKKSGVAYNNIYLNTLPTN